MGGRSLRGVDPPAVTTPVVRAPVRRALPRPAASSLLDDRLPVQANSLLDAQHTAGNRAVTQYLRGAASTNTTLPILAGKTAQRGWSDATSGGAATKSAVKVPPGGDWNAQDIVIGRIRRIAVGGLDTGADVVGNVKDDAREGTEWGGEGRVERITEENAIGKALILVPEPFDKKIKTVDVVIYLHGFGIGYRQRIRTRQQNVGTKGKPKIVDEEGMTTGTVRDIEVDRMEEQLDAVNAAATAAGGRPMVAVLPQGRYTAAVGVQFGEKFSSEAYLDKAFGKVAALSGVQRGRAVLAGHSGAGGTLAPMLGTAVDRKGELKSAADQQAGGLPQNLAEVVLFDAVNSPRQRGHVERWLIANIRKDLREMKPKSPSERDDYLKNNLVRFRGYFSAGSGYVATYTDLRTNVAAALRAALTAAAGRPASRRRAAVPGFTLTAAQVKALQDNYVNSIQQVSVGHEKIMGRGKVKEALGALPVQKMAAPPATADGPQRYSWMAAAAQSPSPARPSLQDSRLLGRDRSVEIAPAGQRTALPVQRVDPPAANPDLAQWTADWDDPQLAGAKRYFNEKSRPSGGPEDRYKIMCPLYKARGITRPLQYLKDSINPSTTFFGHITPAHTGMQGMLTAAETALRALTDDKGSPRFTSSPFKQAPWALNVRTTSRNTWSNHADGRAIDLDPNTNPHLDNAEHRAIINEMTGFDIQARNPADAPGPAGFGFDVYDAIKMTSDRFSGVYSEAGLTARSDQLTADRAALVGQRDALTANGAALKAQRQDITKDRDAALKLTKVAAERAAIKQKAVLDAKEVDKQQADLKRKLTGKKGEIAAMTKRADRIAAELKKFKREQKAFDATVASITAAETGIATATTNIAAATALRDTAQQLVTQARKDKKPKAEIKALQKDLSTKSAALTKAKAVLAKNKKSLKDNTKKRDDYTLRKYAREGILNLPKEVVQAMKTAGFRWGGDWEVHKDIMHFDML